MTKAKDARIDTLKFDLHVARRNLLEILPPAYARILSGWEQVRSLGDYDRYRNMIVDEVLEGAGMQPLCPLCHSEGVTDERGYLVPDALRRHLLGENSVQGCVVMATASRLALDAWRGR